jgi:hypothetical protein
VGFDPSYDGPDTAAGGRARFERRFYDETANEPGARAVVCRHVIEHVQRPVDLLRMVCRTLGQDAAQIFLETPCVEWILRTDTVWDFFYEHCSYFSAAALTRALERAGFSATSVTHVFGDQYLWAEARPGSSPSASSAAGENIARLASAFAAREAALVDELRGRIAALARRGPVALWGAAGKGVTLANLVDPDVTQIACVVDINPKKHGKFLPGSGHRIVPPSGLGSLGIRTALVTNPNYLQENARILESLGLDVELVDLMRRPEVPA